MGTPVGGSLPCCCFLSPFPAATPLPLLSWVVGPRVPTLPSLSRVCARGQWARWCRCQLLSDRVGLLTFCPFKKTVVFANFDLTQIHRLNFRCMQSVHCQCHAQPVQQWPCPGDVVCSCRHGSRRACLAPTSFPSCPASGQECRANGLLAPQGLKRAGAWPCDWQRRPPERPSGAESAVERRCRARPEAP